MFFDVFPTLEVNGDMKKLLSETEVTRVGMNHEKDHNPPHIHFTYGDYECSISVLDRIVDGQAPAKVIAKVNEWINLHEAEILSLWEKAQKGEKIDKIEPLK